MFQQTQAKNLLKNRIFFWQSGVYRVTLAARCGIMQVQRIGYCADIGIYFDEFPPEIQNFSPDITVVI